MEIRILRKEEILPALRMTWEVFVKETAPSYESQEGVKTFADFIKYDHIMQMIDGRQMVMFGAVENQEIAAVLALKSTGHISFFYVRPEFQGRGLGAAVFGMTVNYCRMAVTAQKLTVNAAVPEIDKYRRLGMYPAGGRQTADGITFVPMEIPIFAAAGQQQMTGKKHTGLFIGIAILALVVFFAVTALFVNTVRTEMENYPDSQFSQQYPGSGDEAGGAGSDGSNGGSGDGIENGGGTENGDALDPGAGADDYADASEDGIEGIEAYTQKDLAYKIEDHTYQQESKSGDKDTIHFDVKYPAVSGMKDEAVQKKINELLMSTAKKTVAELYDSPSQEMKEKIITTENPYLISYVDYKVTFASDDLISVVYNDSYCKVTEDDVKTELRCLNISLKDGKVYEVKDIINVKDDKFLSDFRMNMQLESGQSKYLNDVSDEDLISALQGEDKTGKYTPQFFVDKDGLEVGFDIHYPADDTTDQLFHWVTAPFKFSEIKDYKNDSEFWSYLGDFLN